MTAEKPMTGALHSMPAVRLAEFEDPYLQVTLMRPLVDLPQLQDRVTDVVNRHVPIGTRFTVNFYDLPPHRLRQPVMTFQAIGTVTEP